MKIILRYPFLLLFPIVLVLPFPLIIGSIALILGCVNLIVVSFFEDYRPEWKTLRSEPMIWIGIFVLLVDSLASLMRADLYFEVRTSRLAFLLIPFVFYLFKGLVPRIKKGLMTSFVLGVVLYILYSYFYLIYFYSYITNRSFSLDHYLKYDLTEYLPGAYHHTYIGMYMTFAIILLCFGKLFQKKWQALSLGIFIFLNQIFMGGKITLVLSLLVIMIYVWKISKNKKAIIGGVALVAGIAVIFLNVRGLFESLSFSVTNRLLSWKCSLKAISQNPWFGMDKEKVFKFLSDCVGNEAISTHSQILNEFVNYGILGTWVLIFYWLLIKRSRGDTVFFSMVFLIIFLCFFENILSLQRGILFVCFFSVIFMLSPENNNHTSAGEQ